MADDAIRVAVDPGLTDLIPGYLQHRGEDVVAIREAIEADDLEKVRIIGHNLRGTGGGYGFDGITEIGAALETAAAHDDAVAAHEALAALTDYLGRVVVLYDE